MRAEVAVIEVSQIFGIAYPGVVDVGVPMIPKSSIVLGAHQPARAIFKREFVLVLAVIANPAAIKLPIAGLFAKPSELTLMQKAPLLNVAGSIEQIVVGCEIKIDRSSDIDTAAGVAANIGE